MKLNKIKFGSHRVKDQNDDCGWLRDERTVHSALISLIMSELAFGGQVVVLEQERIVTKTSVMGCADTTEFVGTQEDLHPLFLFACATLGLFEAVMTTDVIVEKLVEKLNHSTFLLCHATPVMVGEVSMRGSLACMLKLNPRATGLPKIQDLVDGYYFWQYEKIPLKEVQEMLHGTLTNAVKF